MIARTLLNVKRDHGYLYSESALLCSHKVATAYVVHHSKKLL